MDLEVNDSVEQTFSVYSHTFKCIPNCTTNFEVFRYCNPKLSAERAEEIWEYYRTLFISAKLKGDMLTSFRQLLQSFISEQAYPRDNSPWESERKNGKRYNDINSYIGVARWMELQYNVDTIIDELNYTVSPEELEKRAERILGTVPFNNYVSYFTSDVHNKLKDPADYDTRKLFVTSKFSYTHKDIRWYVCDSEFGAVKVWVHTKHNPFLQVFEKRIAQGLLINVVTSKILRNIDGTIPYIKIENFFVED